MVFEREIEFLRTNNLLNVLLFFRDTLLKNWVSRLPLFPVRIPQRDMDLCGKLPFACRMIQLGLVKKVFIDYSNSGGNLSFAGNSPDGMYFRTRSKMEEYINTGRGLTFEIKGALCEYSGTTHTIHLKPMRVLFNYLQSVVIFVLRDRNPKKRDGGWSNIQKLPKDMHVGHIPMKTLVHILLNWYKNTRTTPKQKKKPWVFKVRVDKYVAYDGGRNDRGKTLIERISTRIRWKKMGLLNKNYVENSMFYVGDDGADHTHDLDDFMEDIPSDLLCYPAQSKNLRASAERGPVSGRLRTRKGKAG